VVNIIESDILDKEQASLSKSAWARIDASEGDVISLSHPRPLQSLSFVRSKIYGNPLKRDEIKHIIDDISEGHYSDIHLSSFLTACATGGLSEKEVVFLTEAMSDRGPPFSWQSSLVVDKHCVGGLPGNRTTPIVVAIVAAFGLTIPKTSSRAITSPAGTADTMETLAPVDLTREKIQAVVEKENGCIIWGGALKFCPADSYLIRIEKAMDMDLQGQMIASVLSKKLAAGSTHIAIDIPVGPTAKVRTLESAKGLKKLFLKIANQLNISLAISLTDGLQPIGRGIGPSLEAFDILAVLQNSPTAPLALKEKSLSLAGEIIEFSKEVNKGEGKEQAKDLLESGRAWQKFQAICEAQGGMREPLKAACTHVIEANACGRVASIDNRWLARLAKIAGAPHNKEAGLELHVSLDDVVEKGMPLMTVHAKVQGELRYALSEYKHMPSIIQLEYCE
jgi:thymidine phosphorylase